MQSLHPDKIKTNSINLKPKSEHEKSKNFKIFESCIKNLNIEKLFDIEKLVKCRFQDNFDLALWLYQYYH